MGRENSKRTITIGKTSYDGDYKFKDSVTGSTVTPGAISPQGDPTASSETGNQPFVESE